MTWSILEWRYQNDWRRTTYRRSDGSTFEVAVHRKSDGGWDEASELRMADSIGGRRWLR